MLPTPPRPLTPAFPGPTLEFRLLLSLCMPGWQRLYERISRHGCCLHNFCVHTVTLSVTASQCYAWWVVIYTHHELCLCLHTK